MCCVFVFICLFVVLSLVLMSAVGMAHTLIEGQNANTVYRQMYILTDRQADIISSLV